MTWTKSAVDGDSLPTSDLRPSAEVGTASDSDWELEGFEVAGDSSEGGEGLFWEDGLGFSLWEAADAALDCTLLEDLGLDWEDVGLEFSA